MRQDRQRKFSFYLHKGSIFKLIWPDLFVFLTIFLALDLLYIFWLKKDPQMVQFKEIFEVICVFCNRYRTMIPVAFLTGFFVTEVVRRYWDQFMSLPFPDRFALKLVTYVAGNVSTSRL